VGDLGAATDRLSAARAESPDTVGGRVAGTGARDGVTSGAGGGVPARTAPLRAMRRVAGVAHLDTAAAVSPREGGDRPEAAAADERGHASAGQTTHPHPDPHPGRGRKRRRGPAHDAETPAVSGGSHDPQAR